MTPGFNANVSEQYQAHLTFEQVQAKALSELTSSSLLVHLLYSGLVPLSQVTDNTCLLNLQPGISLLIKPHDLNWPSQYKTVRVGTQTEQHPDNILSTAPAATAQAVTASRPAPGMVPL